jgi:AcrR family transcriptional regulator
MRRVARELEIEAASLYTHVRSKDDLIDGVIDLVLDRVALPNPGPSWRDDLVAGFTAYRGTLIAQPAIVGLMTERGRFSGSQLRLVELSIELLESSGLSTAEAVSTHVTLVAFTLGFVAQELARPTAMPGDLLASSPVLQRAVQALLATSVESRFLAGLDRILDGAHAQPQSR